MTAEVTKFTDNIEITQWSDKKGKLHKIFLNPTILKGISY